MRTGKTQQLVEWVVQAITDDPDIRMIVAAPDSDTGKYLMACITEQLITLYPELTESWRFSPWRIRTADHGHIELFASRRDRVVRGYKVDEFLAHEDCAPSVIETGRWAETIPNGQARP